MKNPLNKFWQSQSGLVKIAIGCALVVIIGFVDYLTGPEIDAEIFYLLPIALVTWFVGKRAGMLIAVISVAVWGMAGVASGSIYSHPLILYGNGLFLLGIFMIVNHILVKLNDAEKLLRANYNKLRELESLRENLVHMIVHDIRNALTGTSGFLELVSSEPNFTDSGREYIRRASSSVENLVEMASSLLDVNRMEANKMPLNLAEFNLLDTAKNALEKLEPIKGTRRLSINPSEGQFTVKADHNLLVRVIQNLLGNALKFTPEDGEIRINIESGKDNVRFSVTNTGSGIPPEYHEKIFEKFGQVGESSNKYKYSTGIGLAFCKFAIEAHGGRIGVDSEVEKGSTFWFVLGNALRTQEGVSASRGKM